MSGIFKAKRASACPAACAARVLSIACFVTMLAVSVSVSARALDDPESGKNGTRDNYQLTDISDDGYLDLFDDTGIRQDLQLPSGDMELPGVLSSW